MKETKLALNVYGLMDNEMARMHDLFQVYLTMPKHNSLHMNGTSYGHQPSHTELPVIFNRIIEMQQIIMSSLAGSDELIQQKVAELALTGDSDGHKG
jgi:hypothetical protein